MAQKPVQIADPVGKLGVLLPGMGAVTTTFIAGVLAVRKGLAAPVGSMTQMGTIRLGKRTDKRTPTIREFVPLASLDDLVFGGWDIFEDDCCEAARKAGVLNPALLDQIQEPLSGIRPWKAVFDQNYVKRLTGTHVKKGNTKWDLMEMVREDIRNFKSEHGLERLVMVWCGSTEIFLKAGPAHESPASLEAAMKKNDESIAPSMIYAYAALMEGVPFANGAPNLTADIPGMVEKAKEMNVPLAGKDFKTGQTWMKTVIAPGLKARQLGLAGWYSTNILGNRDGEVLDDPDSFKTKEESKLSVLEHILQPDLYPELYKNFYHKVRINYYP
ncbi:MAG: inositol-3-phosphate synthase, partial [Ignavibacteria bacterium]|nr:inositol-3-phosphate synthase [Ignavibacteria bacterium]